MRAWMLPAGATNFDQLFISDLPDPAPAKGEVLMAPKAWSLNYRDFAIASGKYFSGPVPKDSIPLSDMAGEVLAIGDGVTAFKPGDHVQSSFFPYWVDGKPKAGPALGDGHAPGMLAEQVVLPESGVVPMANSLDFAHAACLPCAGVTAWNALFEGGRPFEAGDTALVLGSGGVSTLALQFAKAAGGRVIATSSSNEKLARLRGLGADIGINYRDTPEWGTAIASTHGGADKIIEVGGTGTLPQSFAALSPAAEIALIGVLSDGEPPNPRALMFTGSSIRGIFVGSAAMAKALNAFVDKHGIRPEIGARFAFTDAPQAYAHAWGKDSFAKTIITL